MLSRWDPERLLDMIERDRIQTVFLVPTHAQMLREVMDHSPRRWDLSSLETFYFNAAALPVPLKEWVIEAFPHVGVHEIYGSTEAGVVTNLRPADALRKAGSVGHPWFMTDVKLLDEEGREVGPGEPGELFGYSPYNMIGYLDDPESTAAAIRPDGSLTSGDVAVRDEAGSITIVDRTKDLIISRAANGYLDDPESTAAAIRPDGYLPSGDVAGRDEEGFITIVDRKQDLNISGAANIYPREIETVLLGSDGVAEVAVVGLPDEKWGEVV